jgi:hypothetical protein
MDMGERRACLGGSTLSVRMGSEHAQECVVCGTTVRDDMTDHPFFGFASSGCEEGARVADRMDDQAARTSC